MTFLIIITLRLKLFDILIFRCFSVIYKIKKTKSNSSPVPVEYFFQENTKKLNESETQK